MAVVGALNVIAALSSFPASIGGRASLRSLTDLGTLGSRTNVVEGFADIANPITPFVVPLGLITAIRTAVIRISPTAAAVKLLLTSSFGVDQVVPISALWLWQSPAGTALTAIKILGTASIEYIVAGER